MAHFELNNLTPFICEPLLLANAEARPIVVPVVKATFAIAENGTLQLAEEQIPVCFEGEYRGEPDTSSYKYEPEVAASKAKTDVVLLGHAIPGNNGDTIVDVELVVGTVKKKVRVFGDRVWRKSFTGMSIGKPKPLDPLPLVWERAFGGWDRSDQDPTKHAFENRNPVGCGFRTNRLAADDLPLPNLETPDKLIKSYLDCPSPAAFGFVSPHWLPRAPLAGTYDEDWEKNRSPLLPVDFDERFFNAAPADQLVDGYLKGDEPVYVRNVGRPEVSFDLPGVDPPTCNVHWVGGNDELQTQLDTVIINVDDDVVILIWRTQLVLNMGPHDIRMIEVKCDADPNAGTAS